MHCSLMGCKHPLLAVTGACALTMPGALSFAVRTAVTYGSTRSVTSRAASLVAGRNCRLAAHTSTSTRTRWFSTATSMSGSGNSDNGGKKRKVVFLGTPDVAAISLELLLQASREGGGSQGATFEIVRAVCNPPARAGRKKTLNPCPVQTLAESKGIAVMTPTTARDEAFLAELEALQPDLCVTTAYGQFLPRRFLDIPKFGTLNVHPSLLPRYRGASPVQRCLEAGEAETGVTVAFTVLKMDAGPVVRQTVRILDGSEKTPQLLSELCREGTKQLINCLPSVFDGTVKRVPQDDAAAVKAAKISSDEARCCFKTSGAQTIHNKVRAFAGWPGTWAMFTWGDGSNTEARKVKLITTEIGDPTDPPEGQEVVLRGDALELTCEDGSVLRILELQVTNKKAMGARAFVNGLRGAPISWVELESVVKEEATIA